MIKKVVMMMEVTIEEFRHEYCSTCYWKKWHGCDIEVVRLRCCCSSLVPDDIELKEDDVEDEG